MAQTSGIPKALHPFISFLAAPTAKQGHFHQLFLFLTDSRSSKRTQDCAWESGRLQHMIQWIPATRGTWQRPRVHMRKTSTSFFGYPPGCPEYNTPCPQRCGPTPGTPHRRRPNQKVQDASILLPCGEGPGTTASTGSFGERTWRTTVPHRRMPLRLRCALASLGSAFIVAALDYLHCQMSGGDDSSAGAWTAAHARTPDLIGTSRWCQSPVSD